MGKAKMAAIGVASVRGQIDRSAWNWFVGDSEELLEGNCAGDCQVTMPPL